MKERSNAKHAILVWIVILLLLVGCSAPISAQSASEGVEPTASANLINQTPEATRAPEATLADGVYCAEFKTDSSMFHVNEAKDGKGILTVTDGKMTIHVSLASKKILNLFVGTAEDAQKEGAALLIPSVDTVTYSDGATEEVYGFDIPVPALDEEFALAIVGTKGNWYDHMVSVSNPVPAE